tara:strand:+ start:1166 stop:1390 length:225 start_codon:yes stop_codon:yes gene_type:complete
MIDEIKIGDLVQMAGKSEYDKITFPNRKGIYLEKIRWKSDQINCYKIFNFCSRQIEIYHINRFGPRLLKSKDNK